MPSDLTKPGDSPTTQLPTVDSVTPASGSGATQTFSFKYSSVGGSTFLNAAYGMINSSLSGAGGCFFNYYQPGNTLYLYNDAGTGVSGTLTPGAATSINNSQCTIAGASFTATNIGNQLTLSIPVTFSGTFTGIKNIYGYAADQGGHNSGWVTLGTWIP